MLAFYRVGWVTGGVLLEKEVHEGPTLRGLSKRQSSSRARERAMKRS